MFQEKHLAKRRLLQATYAQRNLRFRLAHFSYWYNDFGEVTENKAGSYSSFDNELQYTGAVYDDSTGLLYLNARFYDPQTGRFISRDTYRGEQDDAGTWHLYLYCANNPVNYVDPSGHRSVSASWIGFGLDVAFTALAGPVKIGYDIVGQGLKYYAKKKGFKLFYDKLMYGAIPRIRGFCGNFFTKIRKAMWRTTGVLLSNAISSMCNTSINTVANLIAKAYKRKQASKIIEFATRLSSLGSAIALVLDIATDKKMNERIKI